MKLSIIICVYNTDKKYLDECLSSISSSTLSDYEIVFIDDGSTADYTDILEKYKPKYRKTENQGHFAARLYGIEAAEGEYITFVDSDDTVSKNYHEPMVIAAEKYGADIVINSWAFHTERTKRLCIGELASINRVELMGEEILPFFTSARGRDHSYFVQWNKIYRRETLISAISELKNTSAYGKRLTYAEDVLLSFFYFKHAKKIVSINSGFYFYRIHPAQSVVPSNEGKIKSHIECLGEVYKVMLSSLPIGKYTAKMEEDIRYWMGLMSRTHYSSARSGKFNSLYPLIKETYGVEKLKLSKYSDGKVYTKSELLGENFDEIDSALAKLFFAKTDLTVKYNRSSVFVTGAIRTVTALTEKEIIYKNKNADLEIPKAKNKPINLIIHNNLVYRIGMLLFKKGSKIRNFLKRHL